MQKTSKQKKHSYIGWLIAIFAPCLIVGGLAGWLFYSEAVNDIGKVYSAWGHAADWTAIRSQGLFGFMIFGLPAGGLGAAAYALYLRIKRNKKNVHSSELS